MTVLESIGGQGKGADTVADIEVEEEVTVDEKELEEQVNDLGEQFFRSRNGKVDQL